MNQLGMSPLCRCPFGYEGDGVGENGCTLIGERCGDYICTENLVRDPATRLIWQRHAQMIVGCEAQPDAGMPPDASCTVNRASRICAALRFEGLEPFVVPAATQLQTLLKLDNRPARIDQVAFPETPPERFVATLTEYVDFGTGATGLGQASARYHVRCVHLPTLE